MSTTCTCLNELNLSKLCADSICVNNLSINSNLCIPSLGTQSICATSIVSHDVQTATACVESLSAPSICSSNLTTTNINASNGVINSLCVPGPLKAANLLNCGLYRASVTFPANTLYTLGTPLNWSVILDDPNGNMTLGPTVYTVPVSGWYIVSIQVLQQDITPSSGNPILGTPIAIVELVVNGTVARQVFLPYLSFVGQQNSLLTSMISLNVGDIVTSDFKVLAVDPVLGLIPIVGTVIIDANGSNDQSLFKIHMLSATCDTAPCSPSIPCVPCTPTTCTPCTATTSNS